MNKFVLVFLLVLLSGCFGGGDVKPQLPRTCDYSKSNLWFEDNNMGNANSYPPDFVSKFNDPKWLNATKYIDVYFVRKNTLNVFDDSFVSDVLVPYSEKYDVNIALNATGATWMRHNETREKNFQREIQNLRKWKSLGLDIKYISLQSVLSKKTVDNKPYPIYKRLQDISIYIDAAEKIFPEAQIGLIDAMPSLRMNWRDAYEGLDKRLDYVHLDAPHEAFGNSLSYREALQVEKRVKSMNMDFGLFLTSSGGGKESNDAFSRNTLASFTGYRLRCGNPDSYILAAWFPYPDNTVPTMTDIIKYLADYL